MHEVYTKIFDLFGTLKTSTIQSNIWCCKVFSFLREKAAHFLITLVTIEIILCSAA